MPELQFAPLWRPVKVNWRYPHTDRSQILETIKSKRARKFLRAHQELLEKYAITIHTDSCSIQDYQLFLTLYVEQITKKGYTPLANQQWYPDRQAEGKDICYFFLYQHDTLIAAKIYTIQAGIYRSAFKASDNTFFQLHHEHQASLGLLIDFLWLDHVMQQSPRLITGGSSKNLFGYANTIGYLVYKMRLGFHAQLPNTDTSFSTTFEQLTAVAQNKPWLAFLSQQPKLGKRLELYSGGEISESNQYQELLSIVEPKTLLY